MFVLFNMIISAIFAFLGQIGGIGILFKSLSGLYSLAVLIPTLAVTVRRLHDIGKTWPWIFIVFVPLIGWIWYIVLMASAGNVGDNQFGPDPKQ